MNVYQPKFLVPELTCAITRCTQGGFDSLRSKRKHRASKVEKALVVLLNEKIAIRWRDELQAALNDKGFSSSVSLIEISDLHLDDSTETGLNHEKQRELRTMTRQLTRDHVERWAESIQEMITIKKYLFHPGYAFSIDIRVEIRYSLLGGGKFILPITGKENAFRLFDSGWFATLFDL